MVETVQAVQPIEMVRMRGDTSEAELTDHIEPRRCLFATNVVVDCNPVESCVLLSHFGDLQEPDFVPLFDLDPAALPDYPRILVPRRSRRRIALKKFFFLKLGNPTRHLNVSCITG